MDKTLGIDVAAHAIAQAREAWSKSDVRTLGSSTIESLTLEICIDEFIESKNASLLEAYISRFSTASYKSPVALLAAALLSDTWNTTFHVCSHSELLEQSAHSDRQYLESCCLPEPMSNFGLPAVVKTVTISVHSSDAKRSIIVTELGDVSLDNEIVRKISEVTGLSHSSLRKRAHLNSADFNPTERLGLEPGIVGPFPHFVRDVDFFIFREMDKPPYVAVRFTPNDTICVDRKILQPLARGYLQSLGQEYILV